MAKIAFVTARIIATLDLFVSRQVESPIRGRRLKLFPDTMTSIVLNNPITMGGSGNFAKNVERTSSSLVIKEQYLLHFQGARFQYAKQIVL